VIAGNQIACQRSAFSMRSVSAETPAVAQGSRRARHSVRIPWVHQVLREWWWVSSGRGGGLDGVFKVPGGSMRGGRQTNRTIERTGFGCQLPDRPLLPVVTPSRPMAIRLAVVQPRNCGRSRSCIARDRPGRAFSGDLHEITRARIGEESPKTASEPKGAVFLSYASQDAEAAVRICRALRAAGIEVFFYQSELRGGDVWDQKIRREIRECALFVPVISANTASRHEGYFRLEWDLADQRSHMMARGRVFVVPVCLDATTEAPADVPESFGRAQWTRLPAGETLPAFAERVRGVLSPEPPTTSRSRASVAPFGRNRGLRRLVTPTCRSRPSGIGHAKSGLQRRQHRASIGGSHCAVPNRPHAWPAVTMVEPRGGFEAERTSGRLILQALGVGSILATLRAALQFSRTSDGETYVPQASILGKLPSGESSVRGA
jgi:TIR domain